MLCVLPPEVSTPHRYRTALRRYRNRYADDEVMAANEYTFAHAACI